MKAPTLRRVLIIEAMKIIGKYMLAIAAIVVTVSIFRNLIQ